MKFGHKDLLGLRDLTAKEINYILDQTRAFKQIYSRPMQQVPALKGKTVYNLFYENSTRTRTSFEQAARMLSASVTSFAVSASSVQKGETLIDTVKNLEVLGASLYVVRHEMAGAPHLIAKNVNVPVINAGDGFNEHPTQGLLDIFSMREVCGDLKGKKIAIVGDISHSRVARSNIWGLVKLGAEVTVVAPPTLMPPGIENMGVKVSYDLDEVIPEVDFLNVLRMQLERQHGPLFPSVREYHYLFGVNKKRLQKAKSNLVILHPGPINRGVEISSDVVDDPRNIILEQVKNGVAVRMAILFILLQGRQSLIKKEIKPEVKAEVKPETKTEAKQK